MNEHPKLPKGEFADLPTTSPIVLNPKQEMAVNMWWLNEAARKGEQSTALEGVRAGAVLVRAPVGFPHDMVLARADNSEKSPGLKAIEDALKNTRQSLEDATLYLSFANRTPGFESCPATVDAILANRIGRVVVRLEDGCKVYDIDHTEQNAKAQQR